MLYISIMPDEVMLLSPSLPHLLSYS